MLPEKIGENLKQEVVASIPFDERIVAYSVQKGVPFMIDNKGQPIGKSILMIAEKVKETVAKQEAEETERVTTKK
jgi:MinD-like ATPase involved in chromosome partitioning or flagellar assembly